MAVYLFIYLFIYAINNQKKLKVMKRKILTFGLLVAVTLSIAMVSSCKKDNVEPVTNQTVLKPQMDFSNWGYDPSDVKSVLKAANYEGVLTKTNPVWDGPAQYDPDHPDDFNCQGYDVLCAIVITPKKSSKDLILTTQGEPTVIKDIIDVEVDENGNGEIIK